MRKVKLIIKKFINKKKRFVPHEIRNKIKKLYVFSK